MALYDTRFGLPQAVVDYLNQGLPDIYQSITQPSITPINFDEPTSSNDLDKTVAPIIQATRGGGGGGDSYSVYNPDPTRTRTSDEYSPYAYRQAMAKSGVGIPSGILSDSKFLYGPQLTGIPGAAANYLQNSFIGKGLDALGNMMPINRRAILENEALGQGIMLNDIGQIVSAGGNINTAENIMAGYNLNKITADTFQKRRDMINEKMKDPVQKAAKLKALDEAEARILGTAADRADMITEQKLIEKYPSLKGPQYLEDAFDFTTEEDDDYEFDPTDPRNFFKVDPVSRKSAVDQEVANRNVQREIARRNAARKSAEAQEKSNRDAAREAAKKSAARKSAVAQEKSNRDAARKTATTGTTKPGTSGGSYVSRGPSYSGMGSIGSGGSSSKSSRNTSSTSTGLGSFGGYGFSDIRLKENVELIGKSPSNINIYKFNYKNNPTTYQGAMAHEVPWASVKHSNGYMMVDYNKIDVKFKKYNA
jgi:hypothetical protein